MDTNETLPNWKHTVDCVLQDPTVTHFEVFIRELLQKLILSIDFFDETLFDLDSDGWSAFETYVYQLVETKYKVRDFMSAVMAIDGTNSVIGGKNLEQHWKAVANATNKSNQ